MIDLDLVERYRHAAGVPDRDEYVAPVKWIKTLAQKDAIREKGLFANQHPACKLRNRFTLETLVQRFGLDGQDHA